MCKHAEEDELVFAYDTFEVEATKADRSDPLSFDMAGRWRLTCRKRAGGTVNERSIGYVTSRGAATDTLLSCMKHASASARRSDSTDPFTLDTIAAGADRCDGTSPMRTDTRPDAGRRGRTY
ncbi:hypothetical protein C450_15303 [Halococcus salifodinae DSM 8989]|uniref:Uncharacterized protein n=1 Tax=Halococcus salifodinae DSM 8989 TaxID=1227456 RepID=M0MXQ0_9EURY|nr:hypothetical protein C450_15303 [Halococcus salifodinae DSM 8989]